MKTKIVVDIQVCIIVPLSMTSVFIKLSAKYDLTFQKLLFETNKLDDKLTFRKAKIHYMINHIPQII